MCVCTYIYIIYRYMYVCMYITTYIIVHPVIGYQLLSNSPVIATASDST